MFCAIIHILLHYNNLIYKVTYVSKINFTKITLKRKHYSICFHIYEKDLVNALLYIYIYIYAVLKKIDKHLSSVDGVMLQEKLIDLFYSRIYFTRNSWRVHRSVYGANYDDKYVIKALLIVLLIVVKQFGTLSKYTHISPKFYVLIPAPYPAGWCNLRKNRENKLPWKGWAPTLSSFIIKNFILWGLHRVRLRGNYNERGVLSVNISLGLN